MPSIPTPGEEFAKLIEFLRKAQESASMIAHLESANDKRNLAIGWLAVSEQLKLTQHAVTRLAQGKLQ